MGCRNERAQVLGHGGSLTGRAVTGLAEGRRAAIHKVKWAPAFHLQDMGGHVQMGLS